MPHFIIEYSANLESLIDISELCEVIRAAAAELDTFPVSGIRVRALKADHFAIADGSPKHGFVDISIRLRGGRPMNVKKDATAYIFATAKGFLASTLNTHSIALSLEMRDIDPELAPKTGSIKDHLEA